MESPVVEKKKPAFVIFREMFRNSVRISGMLWRDHKGKVVALGSLSAFVALFPFVSSGALALLINELVNAAGIHTFTPSLVWLVALLIAASVVPQFLFAWQDYIGRIFWFSLQEKIELLVIERRGAIDLATHENPKQNDLFQKVNENGVWRVQNFTDRQFYLIQNILQVIIAGIVIALSQWWLLLVLVAGTLPELLEEVKYGTRIWDIMGGRAESRRRFYNLKWHFEEVPMLTELKLFQNVGHFLGIIKELFRSFLEEDVAHERKRLFQRFWVLLASQFVIAVALIWYVGQTVHGVILIGTLTFLLAAIGNLRQGLSGLFQNMGRQYQDSLFVTDVFKLVDIKPALIRKEKEIALDVRKTPEIVFEDVSFAYPGTNKLVLENFSLRIKPGEKIAFVGANGAGKTTIVKLLCRFYDPTKGQIMVDGHDLKDINLENWYAEIGALFQEYAHYNFLAKEAIGMGNTSAPLSLARVKEAARGSEADAFIQEWENHYEQMLGKSFTGGIDPSVGQWQKLALARTFYRNPRILILDEPTSSIDTEAEAKIFEKLEALPKDISVILISHRFSTVRQANRIIVLKNGTIEEQGTHRELMKFRGDYARLFAIQAKQYKA
jgi:ATP-binding cassette subfamily B protein